MRCSEQAARKRGFTMKTQLGWRAMISNARFDASRQIHSYAELQKNSTRICWLNIRWIGPDGCPNARIRPPVGRDYFHVPGSTRPRMNAAMRFPDCNSMSGQRIAATTSCGAEIAGSFCC